MSKNISAIFCLISLFLFSSVLYGADKTSPLDTWKVGISVRGYTEYPQEEFDAIAAAGFQCVEMSLSWSRFTDEQKLSLIKDFKAKCDRAKLEIWSVHIPFARDLDISSPDPKNHQKMVDETLKLFNWNQYIGAKVFVIHSSSEPIADQDRPERLKICIKTLRDLTAKAKDLGILLAMENLPRTCLANNAKELCLILNESGSDTNWCFDSNHLLQEKPEEFVQRANRTPVSTHISDYDFIDERHWIPYDGQINWNKVINALVDKGYQGPCIFEGRKRKDGGKASYDELFQIWKKLQKEAQ